MKLSDKAYFLTYMLLAFMIAVFSVAAFLSASRGYWAGFGILLWLSIFFHIINITGCHARSIHTRCDQLEKKIDSILESIKPN